MAELIDKKTTRKIIEKYFESLAPSHYYKMDLEKASVYLDAEIAELPTTTEAEIRASVIDELENIFIDKWSGVEDALSCDTFVNILVKVADELKEEQ